MTNRIILFTLTALLLATPSRLSAAKTVTVSAGNLQNLFNTYNLTYEYDLTLKGRINGSDVKVLRKWANPQRVLNLTDCRIVAGGDPYYEDYTTEDDVIGSYMFADKEFKSLLLPNTLVHIGTHTGFGTQNRKGCICRSQFLVAHGLYVFAGTASRNRCAGLQGLDNAGVGALRSPRLH